MNKRRDQKRDLLTIYNSIKTAFRSARLVLPLLLLILHPCDIALAAESLDMKQLAAQLVEKKKAYIQSTAQNALLIRTLENHRTQLQTLDLILRAEQTWLKKPKEKRPPYIFQDAEANALMASLRAKTPEISEIIITDANGATVYGSPNPSDFWQGDEEKFIQPAIKLLPHVGAIQFDESTQTYQVQLSAPIINPDTNRFLGVFIAGIELPLSLLLQINVNSDAPPTN